jgi:integrase
MQPAVVNYWCLVATIRERSGRFEAIIRRRGHARMARTFATRRLAEQWARQTESAVESGDIIGAGRYTLADAIDRFLTDPDRRKAVLSRYDVAVLAWWRAELGHRRLASLGRADFISARDKLRAAPSRQGERLAPGTVNRRMSAISAVLTRAMAWDWIARNPARVPRVTEGSGRERLLTPAEMARILDACGDSKEPALLAFVVAAASSGARAGELVALRWRDLDLEAGIARVLRSKNGSRRAIAIRGWALDLLRALKASRRVASIDDADHVFRNATGFAPFYYRLAWQQARDAAGVHDVRFHDLRHAAASAAAAAGATQRELMELLGHRSPQMVKRYSHFFDEGVTAIGDRVAARLFGDRGTKP